MVNAYRTGELSLVYPLMRGVAPLITALLGIIWLRELPALDKLARHAADFDRRDRAGPASVGNAPCSRATGARSASRWRMQR